MGNAGSASTAVTTYYTPHNAPAGFDWIVRLGKYALEGDDLRLTAATASGREVEVVLSAVAPEIWRMRIVIPGLIAQPKTPILLDTAASRVPLVVGEDDGGITLSTGTLSLRIDREPICIRWLDPNGNELCRENPFDIDGLGRPFILPLGFVADSEQPIITETLHLRPDEHLYGLGEKFTPLDKRGQRIIGWTQDAFGSTSERSHKNIPFLISSRGYGLLLNTGARITWELGTISCQSYSIIVEGTTFDAYLIYGKTPGDILERYTALTGRAPVPPRWSFGLWLSGGGAHRTRAAIERLVEQAEALDLPTDVIHVDTWWMKWRTYADFRFDEDAFPDPQSLIDAIHARGLKLSVWEQPYISVESDLFRIGEANGYFLTRPNGEVYVIDYGLSLAPRPDGVIRAASPENSWNAPVAIIDMTNPDAVAWYQELHRPLLGMGIDVFKTDFGEDVPPDARFHDGQTGATMHNLYPLLYNRAVSEVVAQEKGYSLVWSRSGTAGSQRCPVCWSGDPAADWDSLACTIRGGLSIGLSGVPFWSSDIGGYRGMPSPRLYVRWAQFTLFCSHARMHGDSAREPWVFGDQALRIVRDYVRLRYRLFPYLYSAAHEASRAGLPVIRAMPLVFPDDANTYDKDLQFMLGDSLLVAPIYDESDRRHVYLPVTGGENQWIDFWTGDVHDGGANLSVHAPLDVLPLYVRGGAILPMTADTRRIPDRLDTLHLRVYPGDDSRYTLLDDTGAIIFTYVETDEMLELTWQADEGRAMPAALVNRFVGFRGAVPAMAGARQVDDGLEVEAQPDSRGQIRIRRLL